MWDGTDLTLSCNYTNDYDNGVGADNVLIIERHSPQRILVSYTLFADASVTIYPVDCASNWADTCSADQLRDEYFNYGDDDDVFSGSLVVTQHTYDEDIETGEFACRLDLFNEAASKAIGFVGNAKCSCLLSTHDLNGPVT